MISTKRLKQDNGIANGEESILQDRISELPDDVIIHILSLLPTIASIKTSLLSKRWKHLWTLVPTFDIDTTRDGVYFERDGTDRFGLIKFVERSLSCPFQSTSLSKFKLRMDYGVNLDLPRIYGWLKYPVLKNVTEFELDARGFGYHSLPEFILNIKGLTCMRLTNVEFPTRSPVCLPSLKELYLINVWLDSNIVNNLLSGCTSLEKLCMRCSAFPNPEFSNSSLKYMELCLRNPNNNSEVIQVKARNLQSFAFIGNNSYCDNYGLNLSQCPAIRNISFTRARLDGEWLENCVSELTLLDSLKLSSCFGMKQLKICSPRLKSFVFDLEDILESLEVTIDAPSLDYFCYTGPSGLKISVSAPNLVNAEITILGRRWKAFDKEWYGRMLKFLSQFNGCKTLHLSCSTKMALIVPNELREIYSSPLPDLKHLKVKTIGKEQYKKNQFRSSVNWIAPSLETLTIEYKQRDKRNRYSVR